MAEKGANIFSAELFTDNVARNIPQLFPLVKWNQSCTIISATISVYKYPQIYERKITNRISSGNVRILELCENNTHFTSGISVTNKYLIQMLLVGELVADLLTDQTL